MLSKLGKKRHLVSNKKSQQTNEITHIWEAHNHITFESVSSRVCSTATCQNTPRLMGHKKRSTICVILFPYCLHQITPWRKYFTVKNCSVYSIDLCVYCNKTIDSILYQYTFWVCDLLSRVWSNISFFFQKWTWYEYVFWFLNSWVPQPVNQP